MISVEEAKELIHQHSKSLATQTIPLAQSQGYALAQAIYAPMDFPAFRQAAMDGYAIRFQDLSSSSTFTIQGEQSAGSCDQKLVLQKNDCIKIFTGALVPNSCDTIVQIEHVEQQEDKITILQKPFLDMHIRPIASQNKKGELIAQKGDALTPAMISLLTSIGMHEVEVHRKPRIAIVTTGKELVQAPTPLQEGEIYESNAAALHAALSTLHIQSLRHIIVSDDKEKISLCFDELFQSEIDILLITGGVSVGDYDFVVAALKQLGTEQLFHKVKQKPGKPLYFGKKNNTLIFGLPGNPASVLTCFYIYVYVAIKLCMGFRQTELMHIKMPLLQALQKKVGLGQFLKAKIQPHGIEVLPHQESYKMNSFAIANALVYLSENQSDVAQGDLVDTLIF
ncbi:MAG: molybdopterin molybdotransferase MoeA [Chitinophagaceae bacterium]